VTEHPTLDRILDRVLGREGGASDEIAAHLSGCEQCREAEAWAADLVAAASQGPPVEAPDNLIARAAAIPSAEPRRRPATEQRWSIARVVQDAFARPLLAGVRGGATARRMLFDLEGGHVDLEVAPAPDDGERFRITAQVMLDDTPSLPDLAAILWRGAEPAARASGDETGTFVLENVPPGGYRLDVLSLSTGQAIRIGRVPVETGPA